MTQLKKNVARRILQGIGGVAMLFGISFVLCGIAIFVGIWRGGGLDLPYARLAISVGTLALGTYVIYSSYLMITGKAFGCTKVISVLLALSCVRLLDPLAAFFESTSDRGEGTFSVGDLVGLFIPCCAVLVYLICVMLLDKLAEAASGPGV